MAVLVVALVLVVVVKVVLFFIVGMWMRVHLEQSPLFCFSQDGLFSSTIIVKTQTRAAQPPPPSERLPKPPHSLVKIVDENINVLIFDVWKGVGGQTGWRWF